MKPIPICVITVIVFWFPKTIALAQTVSTVPDVADTFFGSGSYGSNAHGHTGYLVIGGDIPVIDAIKFDLSSLAGRTLVDFSITTSSVDDLTVGLTGSIPFGYYVGGFTENTTGNQIATQPYVSAGILNFEIVPTTTSSLTGIVFSGFDLTTLAQSWAGSPSTNYGLVFASSSPALVAATQSATSSKLLETREVTSSAPFGTATSLPAPEPSAAAFIAVGLAAAAWFGFRRRAACLQNVLPRWITQWFITGNA